MQNIPNLTLSLPKHIKKIANGAVSFQEKSGYETNLIRPLALAVYETSTSLAVQGIAQPLAINQGQNTPTVQEVSLVLLQYTRASTPPVQGSLEDCTGCQEQALLQQSRGLHWLSWASTPPTVQGTALVVMGKHSSSSLGDCTGCHGQAPLQQSRGLHWLSWASTPPAVYALAVKGQHRSGNLVKALAIMAMPSTPLAVLLIKDSCKFNFLLQHN